MSAEIAVSILLTAVGGLCFLMWNTDGSIDYVPLVLGTIIGVIALAMMVWDAALTYVAVDIYSLPLTSQAQAKAIIEGRRPASWVIWTLVTISLALTFMPKFFSAVRKAQKK